MFTSLWRGLRRFFGFDQVASPTPTRARAQVDAEAAAAALAPDWWIPKDRRAKEAAQLEARRKALIERLERGKAHQDAQPTGEGTTAVAEHPTAAYDRADGDEAPAYVEEHAVASADDEMMDVDLEEFTSLDEVAAMLEDRRRQRDEEERRIESIEIPQAMMMDDAEYAVAKDWMLDHRTMHPLAKAEIFGQYWVHFSRSSAGDTVSLGCSTCGRSKILTDLARQDEPAAQPDGTSG
jgi:hypothetical protein